MKEYKTKRAFVEEITEDDSMTWKLVTMTIYGNGERNTNTMNYGSSYQAEIAKSKFFKEE